MRDFGEGATAGEYPVIGVGIGNINVDFLGLIISSDITDNFPMDKVVTVGGNAAMVKEPFWSEEGRSGRSFRDFWGCGGFLQGLAYGRFWTCAV
ncbi:hypothetical protein [Rothia sp. 11254D007CT]